MQFVRMQACLALRQRHALFLSQLRLDRCETKRSDASWLEQQALHPSAKVAFFSGEEVLVREKVDCFMPFADARRNLQLKGEVLLLGVGAESAPVYATSVPKSEATSWQSNEWQWLNCRAVLARAAANGATELATIGLGKSLTTWHANNQFCPKCGGKTALVGAGVSRKCQCGESHFPRLNPCAIMLVLDGSGRCLLGKIKGRPLYSTLAGFCSHGESVEETVAREVAEESGVHVEEVQYYTSQSWPFPFQLMMGFYAVANRAKCDINYDPNELDDAKWFTKEQVKEMLADRDPLYKVPPLLSISHELIRAWAHGEVDDNGISTQRSQL